ncbi:MAG TPA: GGDEF domain-containing protein [Solirubrobacterales bacterium]|jgi:diguanylate cyclase (GGDEF)-like protein|nr:GGDEF domain-containing protein [Solirubrobacterales bacterium]
MAHASLTSTAMPAFAEAPDERARMGRISGVLWILASFITVGSCYLPGAQHVSMGWVFALSAAILVYGMAALLGWLRWDKASMKALGIGMVFTIPVIGLGIYFTGGAMSFVQPMLVTTLLYAAFFFPARWAWPLSIELILIAGTPLLYDANAIEEAFLPNFIALVAGFLSATWVLVGLRKRLLEAELHQRDIAHRDPLTGVANRRQFDAVLQREIAARTRPSGGRRKTDDTPLALLILDLDDFKTINDNYGHPVGDAILCQVAKRAQSILRSGDTLARIGGDEFAIVAPGVRGEAVRNLAESVCHAVGTNYSDADTPSPSASIGWAVFPEDGHDFETLISAADERMLSRKRAPEALVQLLPE